MTNDALVVVVNAPLSAGLLERISALSPRIRLFAGAALVERPELLDTAEVLLTQHLDVRRIEAARSLRWVQTFGAGVEWLLSPGVESRPDLVVTNARGIHAQTIAEHVFGFLFMMTHGLDRAVHQQQREVWDDAIRERVVTLAGSTLGILGFGSIGRRIADLGKAIGMRVVGLQRRPAPAPGVDRVYGPDSLHEFLREAQYCVNALPLTADTRKILGAAEFRAMRPDSILVNIGRGGTVDTEALVAALREGHIAGAALDVTDPEPLPAGHPLWRMPNVVITPHYAGAHPGYAEHVAEIFIDNLARYCEGRPLLNVVDKRAGY